MIALTLILASLRDSRAALDESISADILKRGHRDDLRGAAWRLDGAIAKVEGILHDLEYARLCEFLEGRVPGDPSHYRLDELQAFAQDIESNSIDNSRRAHSEMGLVDASAKQPMEAA